MGLKVDLIKYLNSNFSISGILIFLKISGIVGGVDSLSMYKVIGSFDLRENIRELFSKKFWGTLNLRGYPASAKV